MISRVHRQYLAAPGLDATETKVDVPMGMRVLDAIRRVEHGGNSVVPTPATTHTGKLVSRLLGRGGHCLLLFVYSAPVADSESQCGRFVAGALCYP